MNILYLAGWGFVGVLALLNKCFVAAIPCDESGYCSVGKLKPFKGDISASGLVSALSTCSYRNEVILLTSTLSVLDNAMQLYNSIYNLGLGHQILLTPDEETCGKATAVRPEICCVWSTLMLPEQYFQHQLLLWNVRRSMAARAVRLGYNIMVIDTDVVIFDDPYKYLKKGPFNDTHLMTMGETWPYETNSLLNLGWLYVQNALIEGPVAAILAEVPDRQLRYADDKAHSMKEIWKASPNCGTDEQLLFDDVVYGSVLGRHVSIVSMHMCAMRPIAGEQQSENLTKLVTSFEQLASGDKIFKKVTESVPVEWQALVGSATMMVKRADLRWWQTRGRYPIEYGGHVLPESRGPLSSAFQLQLTKECKDGGTLKDVTGNKSCPMWPDSVESASRIKNSPVERYALAPHWLVASFSARGVQGYWGQHPGHAVQQVIGHIHQTYADGFVGKRAITQYLGRYNWTLAKQVQKGPGVFFASQQDRPLPQAVALVPCLDLGKLIRSLEDFKEILRGMAAVAALLGGRAVLYPDLPCSLPFIEENAGSASAVPLKLQPKFMAKGELRGQEGASCTWQSFMIAGCVSGPLLSLLSWEWGEYLAALKEQGIRNVDPSVNNTATMLAAVTGKPACIMPSADTRRRRRKQMPKRGELGSTSSFAEEGSAGDGMAGEKMAVGLSEIRMKRGRKSIQLGSGDIAKLRSMVDEERKRVEASRVAHMAYESQDEDEAFANTYSTRAHHAKRQLLHRVKGEDEVVLKVLRQQMFGKEREARRKIAESSDGRRLLLQGSGIVGLSQQRNEHAQDVGIQGQGSKDDTDCSDSKRYLLQDESLGISDQYNEEAQDVDVDHQEEYASGRRRGRSLMGEEKTDSRDEDAFFDGSADEIMSGHVESGSSSGGGMGNHVGKYGGVGTERLFVWEADAQELMQHVLHQIKHEQVVYLRRPVIVDWGHPQDGSELKHAKERFDRMLEGCFSMKPIDREFSSLLKKRWSPTMMSRSWKGIIRLQTRV
ncbi:hypothetical protein CEUSTIGMA_g6267.t1 [Chlamydomonas eustigma]|uniref:Nucleotide-diphospho-sugar transferase domain-containing protein n=1 Tax=Chlamydomonas eustigma TaxID=1157962 RepID=A0A250X7T9_9CHLO|nr:hypothetical protein CEUSTIGMA_g6267.t1 [Chlamydomonas eustigma]|eukprot:GAX78830.1 hypothetical protein CEUSTIGMA_g6267.t1 [Chlamydomonas eustigma]